MQKIKKLWHYTCQKGPKGLWCPWTKAEKKTKPKGKQAAQELKRVRSAVQEKEEEELLSALENVVPSAHNCTCCASGCSMPAEQRALKEEVAELTETVAQLRALNARLQKALTSKVFASESRIIYASSMDVSVTAAPAQAQEPNAAPRIRLPTPSTHDRLQSESSVLEHAAPRIRLPTPSTRDRLQSGSSVLEHAAPRIRLPTPSTRDRLQSESSVLEHVAAPCIQLSAPATNDRFQTGSSVLEQGGTLKIAELPESGGAAAVPRAPMSPTHIPDDDLFCSPTQEAAENDFVDTQEPLAQDCVDFVIGSPRDDGKVYAGCGLWVSQDAWGTLFRATSDSMFCRLASTMYWTPDELKNRSVTGTLSNKSKSKGKTEAKQALTPQKLSSLKGLFRVYMESAVSEEEEKKRMKDVRKHLAQKLADCQRK
ncbi:hypothetical protein MTO96_051833 [Rhipicephalus appendiculatus]